MFTQLAPQMNEYAEGVRQVMDYAWENEGYKNWASRWMYHCGLPPENIERRRHEFEENWREQTPKLSRITVESVQG